MHIEALIQYLLGLSENNNKAWFVMNKPSYDILREEFTVLLGDVIAQIGKFDSGVIGVQAKDALFRIYRDVRFSHDKTPYKTTFSAAISAQGRKRHGAMYYFAINAEGKLHTAAGCYMPEKEMLAAIREGIVKDSAGFKKVATGAALRTHFGGLDQSQKLTRPPKGFESDPKYDDWIRLKSFFVSSQVDVREIDPNQLAKTIAAKFKSATPLVHWLRGVAPKS